MLLYLLVSRDNFQEAMQTGKLAPDGKFSLYTKNQIKTHIENTINSENYNAFVLLTISTKKLHTILKKKNNCYYLQKKISINLFEDIVEFDYTDNGLSVFTSSGKEYFFEEYFRY